MSTRLGERLGGRRRGGALLRMGLCLGVVGMGSTMSGCGGDGLGTGQEIALNELYWALELNHHAVALAVPEQAPYDTLRLVATPRTVDGAPLSGLPAPTYVSGDQEKVVVGSDGVLRAIAPTAPGEVVPVVATLTAGNLKHIDTVLVTVLAVDPRPVLASLSIQLIPNNADYADSAKVGAPGSGGARTTTCFALPTWTETPIGCQILLPVTVLDAAGDAIPGVPVAFRSSDAEAAAIRSATDPDGESGKIILNDRPPTGQVTFYASTTVFGVTKVDALPLRIGWPVLVGMDVSQTGFSLPVLKVGAGAIVRWSGGSPFDIDINFVDPTQVASVGEPRPSIASPFDLLICLTQAPTCDEAGNAVIIPRFNRRGQLINSYAYRRFPVPGTYDYSSTALGGIRGRILVLDER